MNKNNCPSNQCHAKQNLSASPASDQGLLHSHHLSPAAIAKLAQPAIERRASLDPILATNLRKGDISLLQLPHYLHLKGLAVSDCSIHTPPSFCHRLSTYGRT